MKRTTWWAMLVAAVLMLGCGTKGSGKAASETRTVAAFSAVEVRGVIELELGAGPAPTVALSGDDNILRMVTTEVSGDRLIIDTTDDIRPDLPLVARVTMAGPVREIVGRGATEIRAKDLSGPSLRVELSGAGKAELAGEVETLELRLSGAGAMDAERLKATTVDADISGAGKLQLGEPDALDADISGAGTIVYGGDPEITKSISGAGTIRKR